MRPDGREAQELSNAPYFNHSNFAWSPDSQQIAYLRFNQDNPTAPPEIWIMNIDGMNPIQLVIGGYAPQWIP
jgi:Tol biopolymer transport system component